MSERKVLNKYYPPDFDPSKIPRMKLAKNRQYTVRLMAPFNMKCKTCGEYIYKGRKFNARKEDVEGDTYLGIRIYRFYIKCTGCCQEIIFKTDPKNTDYEIEVGATRNFMALLLAEKQAKQEQEEEKEEEASNPMKLLENRTQQSKREMDIIESLEELKDLNKRQQIVNYDQMLEKYDTTEERIRTEKEQEEYDEQLVKEMFKNKRKRTGKIVEEETIEIEEELFNQNQVQELSASSSLSSTASLKPKLSLEEKRKKLGIVLKKSKKDEKVEPKKDSEPPQKTSDEPKDKKTEPADAKKEGDQKPAPSQPSGLSLLGAYSGSDSDENED